MGFIGDMEDLVLNSPDEEHDYEAELRALQSDDNSDEESSKSGKKGFYAYENKYITNLHKINHLSFY